MVLQYESLGTATADRPAGAAPRRDPQYVRWLQGTLNRVMGAGLAVDGVYGSRTRAAVRAFQVRQGLPADGVVGERTERALVAADAGRPPSTGTTPATAGPRPEVSALLPSPGPGYYSHKPAANRYGRPETIRALQTIGAAWQRANPRGPRIGVGDISYRGGGPMRGHVSHQKGVDVDLHLVRGDGREEPVTYHMATYSRALTQQLVDLIHGNGVLRVQYIFFNDPAVRGVRRWPNHDNHLHVRFFPPAGGAGAAREAEGEAAAPGGIDRRSPDYFRWLQRSLNQVAGAGLAADGVIGRRTRDAVRAFQSGRGLPADGVAGPATERALIAAGAPPPPRTGTVGPAPLPARGAAAVVCGPPEGLTGPERTAVALTSRFETGTPFACVVSATDGISMGMLQWNLLAGTLQAMLHRFEERTGRLRDFFGPETPRVKTLIELRGQRGTRQERKQQLKQAVAEAKAEGLADRWRPHLLRLCADPQFCGLLMADVRARLRRAQEVARRLGLQSVRGLAMTFDIVTGDGLGEPKVEAFAARIARRQAALGRPPTEREKLVEIANEAADQVSSWREERRARRLLIANGTGTYRRSSNWDLNRDFPTLDERWE